MENLEENIRMTERAIQALPLGHQELCERLNDLGNDLFHRYLETGSIEDLEQAIHIKSDALVVTPHDHLNHTDRISNLAAYLYEKYLHTGAMKDVENAVRVEQQAVDATPSNHWDRARRLNNLAIYLADKYSLGRAPQDLQRAIHFEREAVEVAPVGSLDRSRCLNNLATHLYDWYLDMGETIADLEAAVRAAKQAVGAISPDQPGRDIILINLAVYLGSLYQRTEKIEDIEEAVLIFQRSVDATPTDHPDRTERLNKLGYHLQMKFERTGAMSDLNGAICVLQDTANNSSPDNPSSAGFLSNLGLCLGERYSRVGEIEDLEQAIHVTRQAIEYTSPNHPDRLGRLNNLGNHLHSKFLRVGAIQDLEDAIQVAREAVDGAPPGHPRRADWLSNLGSRLECKYFHTGNVEDLEQAVSVMREAVESTPFNHPDRARWLSNLGCILHTRYFHTGTMQNLEDAIRVAHEAVDTTPPAHSDRAGRLNNLANHQTMKYRRTGAMQDLENAITVAHQAVEAMPSIYPNRALLLSNLGSHLGQKYSRTGAMADLQGAIDVTRQAISATWPGHPDRGKWLNNLANRLADRYSCTGQGNDSEEAVRLVREAVNVSQPNHLDYARSLNNLGNHLSGRYHHTGQISDLEEAIKVTQQAVFITPIKHPERSGLLKNLGLYLRDRYSLTGKLNDLKRAKEHLTAALQHPTSPLVIRVEAGRDLLCIFAALEDTDQIYTIAEDTVHLIPLLAPSSLQIADKQYLLNSAVGLSSDAAAIALNANRSCAAAVKLLETGRCVIAGAALKQSEISSLEKEHPELARSFIHIRDRLDAPPLSDSFVLREGPTISIEAEDRQREEACQQLPYLLETIRSQPSFKQFLLSTSEADMLTAALYGPIVILNVSSYRCDAFIINQSGIRLLELPHLSQEAINDHVGHLRSFETLGWLWDDIVHPVLDELGFASPPSNNQWPHVWWVPTGRLSRFPLHAAGHHLRRSGETALDRVISSYGSSVKAIIHSRRRRLQTLAAGEHHNIVVVAMQDTPKQEPLGFAGDEISAVLASCGSMGLQHIKPQPRKNEVSSALESCWIFHFAGHGGTHPTEPLHSRLLLEDWERDPFTVENLLETDLASKPPFLAYLSACGTSQVLDETSVDESIHLASAFQLAGFRHVIGTLWSVDDRLSVDMARITYEFLRDKGVRDESVSGGLHHATRLLRDRWVDSETDVRNAKLRGSIPQRDGSAVVPERKWLHWVPYVHYGA